MLWRVILLLFIPVVSATFLLADDDLDQTDDFEHPILSRSVSIHSSPNAPSPLTSLESEPSGFVHGCINVITGQFCDTSTDLVVHHGTDPLTIERTFIGATVKEGTLGVSWYSNHSSRLRVRKSNSSRTGRVARGMLHGDHGGALVFERALKSKSESIGILPLERKNYEKGVTNASQGCLSGQTNLKNHALTVTESDCRLTTGSPRLKIFDHLKKKSSEYYLKSDVKDSGNTFSYYYDYIDPINGAFSVSILNKNGARTGSLNFSKFNKTSFKKKMQYEITTNDGRWVRYSFIKVTGKRCLLIEAERSDAPKVEYEYESMHETHLPGIRYITLKRLPKSRVLQAQYYVDEHHNVMGRRVKVPEYDPRNYRVHTLLAPAGVDAVRVPIYHFFYHFDTDKGVFSGMSYGFKSGACEVYDALHRKTTYEFNADHRLTSIQKHALDGNLYSTERLCWGDNNSSEATCLTARSFEAENTPVFARVYKYDAAGNVLKDCLYGNLSGTPGISLQLNADGSPVDNGSESFCKSQKYSDDGRNLLLEESDGVQTTSYEYAPQTTNIIAKFLGTDTQILRRWFYSYNDDAALTKEIVDDGITRDPSDLSGVTERQITEYTQSKTYPVGFPLVIEKKCLDIASGREALVHKVVNTYTNCAQITSQEHYDSNGSYCFTLFWKYDNMGNVIEETDALGRMTIRRYDENGNCIFEQKNGDSGMYKEFVYDFMNRLVTEKEFHPDGDHRVVSHRYDLVGDRIATVDAYGNETNFYYDAFHRLIRTELPAIQDEANQTVRPTIGKRYNALSHVTAEIDANGIEKRMTYTVRGQLVSTEYPDGTTERNTYHLNGTLKETKARNGTITRFTHDALGRPVQTELYSESNEFLSKTSIIYSGFHIIKEIDALGIETSYSYYPDGKLKSKQSGDALTEYVYDPLGRIAKTKEHHGGVDAIVKTFQYDVLDRVIEEGTEDATGAILLKKTYGFDDSGRLAQVCNYHETGISPIYTEFNSHGQAILSTDQSGNKTVSLDSYDYINALGQSVPYKEVTDPQGNMTVTIQDALGRPSMTLRKNSLGKVTQKQTNRYDVAGNLCAIIDTIITPGEEDRDVSSQMSYDTSGRLVMCRESVGTPEQKQLQIVYNKHGQKQRLIKNDGVALVHDYDALGRLKSLASSDKTVHYAYTYDLNGNPVKVDDLVHHTFTSKQYDAMGRLIKDDFGNGLSIGYQYDGLGRVTQVTLPDHIGIAYGYRAVHLDTVTRLNGAGEALYAHRYMCHDHSGLLLEETLPGNCGRRMHRYSNSGSLVEVTAPYWNEEIVKYDSVGNILETHVSDARGKVVTHYQYDDLYQLTGEEGILPHHYVYDSLYNRRSKDGKIHCLNGLNQLLDDGVNQYIYDLNGNLCRKKSVDRECHYTYDALDRLVSFSSEGQKVVYFYDENNRRLVKTQYSKGEDGDWQPEKVERYLYQGQNEIGSVDDEGTITELRVLGIGKGAEIGAAVAMELAGKFYVPIHDHSGNVACLLDGTTGEPAECYRYTAFGEMDMEDAITPWRFSSKRYDTETGFTYFGRRYYSSEIGRWVTPDPIGREGGPNLYAYVLNSPLTHIDLYGLAAVGGRSEPSFGGLIAFLGRVIGGILSLPGKVIEFLGFHLVPMPYVKDAVEFGGWCLSGKNPSEFVPSWNRPHSKLIKHDGYGYGDPKYRHVLYCGIGTTETEFRERLAKFSREYGRVTVWGVYNDTQGFLLDLAEVVCQKLGIPRSVQRTAERATWAIVDQMGEYKHNGTLLVEAHSQGAETVYNLSEGLRQMMKVTAIGPARILHEQDFKSARNYINRFDFVPFCDPVGLVKGLRHGNVYYLPTSWNPISDHLYESKNFQSIRTYDGRAYKIQYGWVQ